nr:DUF3861 domain-containing protein [Pseudoxanthomonas sp.]
MANRSQRYRITVTPVEADGLPCTSRCTIEFEHHCHDDWMRVLENIQRLRGFSGDERAALVIGTQLLSGLMASHRKDQDDLFAPLRPHVDTFLQDLRQRAPG